MGRYLRSEAQHHRILFEPCKAFLKMSYNSYIYRIAQGEWADDFSITATANMLNIRIIIINDRGWVHTVNPSEEPIGEIYIGHIGQYHYVALDQIEQNVP